ncbi:MAG: hypothetical protein AB1730_02020 [Myxococcota bacterium]|jgi:hypothetical protein
MLPLVLALSLAQVDTAAPTPPPEPPPADQPVEGTVPPVELIPSAEPGLPPVPPASAVEKKEFSPPSRVLLSGGAGIAAGFAGLGIAVALTGSNPGLDTNFATAMVTPILLTGVSFMVHQALGGRGEVILAYVAALALMAGAAGLAVGIEGTSPMTPLITTLTGTVPATAAAVLILEASTRKSPRAPQIALLPTGIAGVF